MDDALSEYETRSKILHWLVMGGVQVVSPSKLG